MLPGNLGENRLGMRRASANGVSTSGGNDQGEKTGFGYSVFVADINLLRTTAS